MPNYLSKPISSNFRNTYSSQFVPLPLEIFARANEKDQAKQDAEVGVLNQASDAGHAISGVVQADNDYVKNIFNNFDTTASSLTNKDLTRRENQDIAKKLIRDTVRDKNLSTIMSNAAIAREYQKNKEEMIKAGTYQAYNDSFNQSLADYAKNGGYKSGKQLDATIHKYSEERPKMEEYFNNLGEDGADSLGKIGETYYKYGFEGVSKAKVNNRAAQAFDGYLVTPEGQQGLRRYNYLKANNPSAVKGIKSGAEYVFNQFLDAGLERVHGKSTSGLAAAMNADAKEKKEETNLFAGLASTELPSNLLGGTSVDFDDKGNIKGDGKGIFSHIKDFIANPTDNPLDILTNWKNDNRLSDEQNTRLKSVVTGAKLNGVSPKEYTEHFNKSWSPVIPQPLTGKALEHNNDAFRKEGSGLWSNISVSREGGEALPFYEAVKAAAKAKGMSAPPDPNKDPKEYNKYLDELGVRVTGAYAPNRLSARSIEIKIGGNTFAGDLTNGGKYMDGVSEKDITAHNLAKLNAGEQITEKDSKGNIVTYYKDIKTGEIKPIIQK